MIRGARNLVRWDPHTGERAPVQGTISESAGQPATKIRLVLPAIRSFFVEEN